MLHSFISKGKQQGATIVSVTSYRKGGHYKRSLEYFQSDFVTSCCIQQTARDAETPDRFKELPSVSITVVWSILGSKGFSKSLINLWLKKATNWSNYFTFISSQKQFFKLLFKNHFAYSNTEVRKRNQTESDTSQDLEYPSPWTASFNSGTCKHGYMGIPKQTFCL